MAAERDDEVPASPPARDEARDAARDEALDALDVLTGGDEDREGRASWEDGHARWDLYRRAADTPAVHGLLLDAVRAETDGPLASSVVVLMLERTPAGVHRVWTAALDPGVRDFAERRAAELAVLAALDRDAAAHGAETIESWSDWLQLRVAQSRAEGHRPALDLLAEHGRTKRIRRTAAESVAALRKSGPRA